MSYLVLARKWRPQTFAEVIGQEHVTRTLTNAIAQGRIHHAFLFAGARGVGKTTAARILAKALCCEKGPTATPCNTCEICREITAGTSVDIQEIDGASNNSVDEVRQLRESVKYQPARARRKIFIIDEVHMLSQSAFNALLKTLEEPPPHVTFIFATTEPHKIPITILSRCQRYDFRLVPTPRLEQHLATIASAEKISIAPAALSMIAREAGGSVRDALSLLDQIIAYAGDAAIDEGRVAEVLGLADRGVLFALSDAVIARDARRALGILAGVYDRGADLGQLARAFAAHLRDLHVTAVCGGDPEGLVEAASADMEEIRARTARVPATLLGALFERAVRAVDEVARSPLPRYTMEAALIDMCHAEPILPLGGLIERLEALEARVVLKPGAVRPSAQEQQGPRREARPVTAAPPVSAPLPRQDPRPSTDEQRGGRPKASAPAGSRDARDSAQAAHVTQQAAHAAPKAEAATPEEVVARWEALCHDLETRDPPLFGVMGTARPVAWDSQRLVIAFDTEAEASLARSRIARIERASGARRVEIVVGAEAAARSLRESERFRQEEEREKLRREARAHPAYKDTLEVFRGAKEREIRPDNDSGANR